MWNVHNQTLKNAVDFQQIQTHWKTEKKPVEFSCQKNLFASIFAATAAAIIL